jgi:hypothetical protein
MKNSVLFGCLAWCCSLSASAADNTWFMGAEGSDSAYSGYVGVLVPSEGLAEQGSGWFQRYWADTFGYEYLGQPGLIEAEAYGAEAAVGWSASSADGYGAISIGYRFVDTELTPDDLSASARGGKSGAKLQFDGERRFSSAWKAQAIASYTTSFDGYWSRLRLLNTSNASAHLGLEVAAQGNDEYDAWLTGLVAVFQPSDGAWSVALKAGYRFQDDLDGAYGGLELSRRF